MQRQNNLFLARQVAVVTGGLGGLGGAVAKKLSAAGAAVVLVDINKISNIGLKKSFGPMPVYFFSGKVDDAKKISQVIKKIIHKFKRIDVVVNCAGIIGPIGEFNSNNLESWKNTININLLGTINVCRAVLPFMVKREKGKIVNFAGGGAVEPFPNFSAYASSKAGVVRFSENLAREYKEYNIEVNAVSPGRINTKLVDDLIKAGKARVGKENYEKVMESKNKGGDSIELATNLVLFLSDPKNKLTGKLVSAKWDPWKKFNKNFINKINQSSEYTLRRIDNKYFYEK